MVGEELAVAHMDATPFFNDCAYLADWPGVPIADEEGQIISAALGEKRAILLDVHFISSLPVVQRTLCKAWADTRPVQIAWAES
jgi:L-fuculose-phosphate aldolase